MFSKSAGIVRFGGRGIALLLACTFVTFVPHALAAAATAAERNFSLPAGDAALTLKQFAAQSGEQIVYLVDNVRGEKTNAVSGKLTARAALDRMASGTALVASQDQTTGALVVGRRQPRSRSDPNVPRTAQPPAGSDRPATTKTARDDSLD